MQMDINQKERFQMVHNNDTFISHKRIFTEFLAVKIFNIKLFLQNREWVQYSEINLVLLNTKRLYSLALKIL